MTESLQAALAAALTAQTGSAVALRELAPIAGGASKETWRCDLTVAAGPWQGEHQLVLLRQMGGKIYADALGLLEEFLVVQAAYAAGAPVPRPYFQFADLLGRPATLFARLDGEAIGRKLVRAPELAAARAVLPAQIGSALAAIHRVDLDATGLRALLPAPAAGVSPIQKQLAALYADLDAIGEPHPALELVLRWLIRHEPPPPAHLVLTHGDYRIGNLLVVPTGLNGVIDWEFAHIGEPYEDLVWGSIREWRFGVDDLRYGGVGQPAALYAAYEAAGGAPVDLARAHYWEVLHNVRWAVGTLNQAQRHLSGAEPNLEFASLGRRCAEMELEALRLIRM